MARTPPPNEIWNMPKIAMPADRQYLKDRYWTPEEAAAAWKCSLATAYRLIIKHPQAVGRRVVALIWDQGDTVFQTVVDKGCQRPAIRRGNPAFRDSAYQSAIARARERQKRLK